MMYKRGNRKVLADYKMKDVYKLYKNTCIEPLSYKLFVTLNKEFWKARLVKLIYENERVKLPARLGDIIIKKREARVSLDTNGNLDKRFMRIDWKRTLKYWEQEYPGKTPEDIRDIKDKKVFYHLNEHTDGYIHKFVWDKVTSNVKNQSAYRLNIVREIKRELAFALKTNKKLNFYG